MKFAICNETFQDWPFDRAFAFAAECGYSGIEMAHFTIADYATDIPAAKRAEVRRQAEAAGLQIVAMHWLLAKTEGFYLTSPEADVRRRTAAYFGELARLCADFGGGAISNCRLDRLCCDHRRRGGAQYRRRPGGFQCGRVWGRWRGLEHYFGGKACRSRPDYCH